MGERKYQREIMSFLPYNIELYKRRRIHTWAHALCILDHPPMFIVDFLEPVLLKLCLSK
jgi:hypothetical protein